jgi:hypothetical protein
MYPPIYQLARDDAAVTALLGSPPRFRPFGQYDQNGPRPYAVWQVIYGNPDNSLSCQPREDLYGVQVDAYAETPESARAVAEALRNCIESDHNPVVGHNGEFWEQNTGLWRVSFTCEFWTAR